MKEITTTGEISRVRISGEPEYILIDGEDVRCYFDFPNFPLGATVGERAIVSGK